MNHKEKITEHNQAVHIYTKRYKNANSTEKEINIQSKVKFMLPENAIFYGTETEPLRNSMYENSILGIEPDFYYNGEMLINKSAPLVPPTHQEEQIHGIKHNIVNSSDKIPSTLKIFPVNNMNSALTKAIDIITIEDSDCEEVKEITAYATMNETVIIDSDNEMSKEVIELDNQQTLNKKKKLYRPGPTKIIQGNQTLYMCNVCRRCYKHRSSFSMHHRTECLHQPILKCRQCSYRANDKMSLLIHVRNTHKQSSPQEIIEILKDTDSWKRFRQYYCAYCQKNFPSSRLRFIHMLKHCCKNKSLLKIPTNFSLLAEKKCYAYEKLNRNEFENKSNQQNPSSENKIDQIMNHAQSDYPVEKRFSAAESLKKDLGNSRLRTTAVAVVQPLHALVNNHLQSEPQPVALVYTKTNEQMVFNKM